MTRPEKSPVSFGGWMGSMWAYTLLRVVLFLALWGIVWLLGVKDVLAGLLIAAILSIPLSFVLLAVPRAHFAAKIEQRVAARQEERAKLDSELDGDPSSSPQDGEI